MRNDGTDIAISLSVAHKLSTCGNVEDTMMP